MTPDMKRHVFPRRHATTDWNFSKDKAGCSFCVSPSRRSFYIDTAHVLAVSYSQTQCNERAVKLSVPCRILVRYESVTVAET